MKRVELIQIKVTQEEKKKIEKLAKKEGLTISSYMRHKSLIEKEG